MRYVVGDIQGCFDELQALLDRVGFQPGRDCLYSVGDLVARGPKSLEVLRLFMSLEGSAKMVLGNHDLHLLAVLCGFHKAKKGDQLEAVLAAPERNAIVDYLRRQPLALWLEAPGVLVTHAGLPPHWGIADCLTASTEVEAALQGPDWQQMLEAMYGNEPNSWSPGLQGQDRLRYIINALTRMRFCYPDGALELKCKSSPQEGLKAGLRPWYQFHPQLPFQLAFGHWAALNGQLSRSDIKALDTGCVWGNKLTLWCLETGELLQQAALS
ncbi:symmetrical bis(5'-nucleosyl)-tetraphosphatase [Gallaecimonas kandeliae]|uniref:symmetrical bis(5'-nucleosyl)-tetraphosphatase n=1 Tax=Gallaecimonas kandeliae TaxID=3029055 RepID=UPI002647658E|nr:symmetrical bis(5'-nucleosyl)-tetraphosphatase [Gallaecimonas kandeliae]WKE66138.1 symmetrical bis(5'-nucleosyl)-tetraphosphatase [Gallaecimonas kandeliae]